MATENPAIKSALEYLERRIAGGGPHVRLPGIRALASAARVSPVTMWKAAHMLKKKGAVSIVHGQGIRPLLSDGGGEPGRDDASSSPVPVVSKQKWKVVKNLIYHDIVNGRYQPGEQLPALKEMAFAYGTSFITLKRSLSALCGDGCITPSRKTFKVIPLSNMKSSSYIIVLTRGEETGELNTWTPWGRELMQTLDKTCAQARVTVAYYIYVRKNGKCVFIGENGEIVRALPVNDFLLGFLVRSQSQDDLHFEVIEKLSGYKKYIAVSDEGACFTAPYPFSGNAKIQLFSLETGTSVGCKTAQFLLHHGHKKIAFFSPFHQTCWSQTRLEGLVRSYESAGLPGAVAAYTLEDIPFPFGCRRPVASGKEIMGSLVRAVVPGGTSAGASRRVEAKIRDSLVRMAEEEELRTSMRHFFEQALLDADVTAWVCVNDRIAMAALDFLKDRGGRQFPSIVSFDDTFDAFQHKISSFNFNISALVNAMLSFVLHPLRDRYRKNAGGRVQIEGTLVERIDRNAPFLRSPNPVADSF
jgi:DNA-binding transcriptional regulator YhcF (GntR family)